MNAKKYFVARLQDGSYIGNMIDGPKTHTFVACSLSYACRFTEYSAAVEAAGSYRILDFFIEQETLPVA